MSSKEIRPSSIDGIKRLAKSIKVAQGIQHTEALDVAARAAGYQNYRHASNVLSKVNSDNRIDPGHRVFITASWLNQKDGSEGREMLTVMLTTPWNELITVPQFDYHRAFNGFRPEGPEHLARRILVQSQSEARRAACALARTLQFMDITKLRPSNSHSKAYPGGRSTNAVPGRDHHSIWYDRNTRRYLFADEPYEKAAVSQAAARTEWAQRHGFVIQKPEWTGMYNPDGGSQLYLITNAEKGIPLDPIVAALNRLPAPIDEKTWDGESAPLVPIFISPGAIADAKKPKSDSRQQKKSGGQRNSVEYIQTFVGPSRRPKERMPIESHIEVGALLKSVLLVSLERNGVYNRLNSVRSELDEWVQREFNGDELSDELFFDLYYHESGHRFLRSIPLPERNQHINSLERVKQILITHYPDCPPLRSLLTKMDAAVKSMQAWTS